MRFLALLFTIFTTTLAYSAQYAMIAGGSGEEHRKENFFAADFINFKKSLEARKWQVQTVFDKDTSLVPGSVLATNENIKANLKSIADKAQSGDEVLLVFHAHGGENTGARVTLHPILTETRYGFEMLEVSEYIAQMRKKGVKVAIADLSCYSGNTQRMPGDACVVTLASSKYVSICSGNPASNSFTTHFVQLPPPQKKLNLEEHFLQSRAKDSSTSNLPQISSIELPQKSFWDFFLSTADPDDIEDKRAKLQAQTCSLCDKISTQQKQWDELKALAEKLGGAGLKKEMTGTIDAYIAANKELAAFSQKLAGALDKVPNWGFKPPLTIGTNMSLIEMQTLVYLTDPAFNLDLIDWLSRPQKAELKKLREHHKTFKAAFIREAGTIEKDIQKHDQMSKGLADKGKDVMAAERKLYALNATQEAGNRKTKACQDFVL